MASGRPDSSRVGSGSFGWRTGTRPSARALRRAAVGVTAFGTVGCLLVAGCGGPGPVRLTNVPVPVPADRASCAALIGVLPSSLGHGLDRRRLDPPRDTAAAYGGGPIVLTCGVSGVPASYRPDSMLSEVDGVGWFAEKLGESVRYSTPTRLPHVVLTLPGSASTEVQPFDILVSVGPAVRAHSASTTP
nr:DUF3515 domain-containing protein [Frankia sp. AiPs1]